MTAPNTNATPLRTVTPRVAGLMQMALDMVDQAIYEGHHGERGEYSADPRRPDAPGDVMLTLHTTRRLLHECLDHYDDDPVDAMRDYVGVVRPIDY